MCECFVHVWCNWFVHLALLAFFKSDTSGIHTLYQRIGDEYVCACLCVCLNVCVSCAVSL